MPKPYKPAVEGGLMQQSLLFLLQTLLFINSFSPHSTPMLPLHIFYTYTHPNRKIGFV